jgi:hypothetical protein
MSFPRREFLYLSVLAAALPDMSRRAFAQVQSGAPKFSQILRQDLEAQARKSRKPSRSLLTLGPAACRLGTCIREHRNSYSCRTVA